MYDIKQFKPAQYLVLVMGMTGFALAVEAPGLWLLSVGVVGLHAWLVRTKRFWPLPRLVANIITLIALLYTFPALRSAVTPIVTIGQFLVFLQLVKLFELRANRDYAQLLVLSLLLMVAGAISTPSLLFGILLVVYLFVSLYVCLLFHLKIENDYALAAQTLPREQLNDATVKQDQRYLARSMRRLAAVVSFASVGMAVFIFLFFPRGTGAGMFGQLQLQPPALTGISGDVSFNSVSNIAQNNEIVAQVQVWRNDRAIEGTQPLLLRGQTLDTYSADLRRWKRAEPDPLDPPDDVDTGAGSTIEFRRGASEHFSGDRYRLKIALRPTGTNMLFALPGVLSFTPARSIGRVRMFHDDESLSTVDMLTQRLEYEVIARNASIEPNPIERMISGITRANLFNPAPSAEQHKSDVSPRIAEYARRPEVSGTDAQGRPLATLRPAHIFVSDLDEQIASSIEKHLHTNFSYTLNLTNEKMDDTRDPNEMFLYDWKKGHCEYFASSMVLMCQSLGLQARMVTGFRCDEYDASLGHYYVVRQSHAHAWVEVRTPAGWHTFDPTSGNDVDGQSKNTTWQTVKHFFDWLEFKWAEKVVAYDGERRENLIANLDRAAVNTVLHTRLNPNRISRKMRSGWAGFIDQMNEWLTNGQGLMFSVKLIIGLIALLGAVLFYGLFTLIRNRRRMRRRAARIGLDNLPTAEQIRLAKQLGFYEQLMTLLENRRIFRPRHQTPAEFSDSLAFLPNEAYDTIRRLTNVFYSIRFGRRQLPGDEQKDLEATVQGLEPILDSRPIH
jgi:transglutaminase-like putative cysteine protease